MLIELFLAAVITAILFSLIKSTDKVLIRRQQNAETDPVRIIDHRSRL
jgi:hypothetical protein